MYRRWEVNAQKQEEERVVVDWKKLEKAIEDLTKKKSGKEEEK